MYYYLLENVFIAIFIEKEIDNLQRELNVVKGCINGQQITQEDKKRIEEDIISLKQDIQYEENCLTEYSNIVYSEDLNVVNVRLKVNINRHLLFDYL